MHSSSTSSASSLSLAEFEMVSEPASHEGSVPEVERSITLHEQYQKENLDNGAHEAHRAPDTNLSQPRTESTTSTSSVTRISLDPGPRFEHNLSSEIMVGYSMIRYLEQPPVLSPWSPLEMRESKSYSKNNTLLLDTHQRPSEVSQTSGNHLGDIVGSTNTYPTTQFSLDGFENALAVGNSTKYMMMRYLEQPSSENPWSHLTPRVPD